MKFVDIFKKFFLLTVTLSIVFGFFCSRMYQHSSMEMGSHEAKGLTSLSSSQNQGCCGDDVWGHIKSWQNVFVQNNLNLKDLKTLPVFFVLLMFVYLYRKSKTKLILKRLLYFKNSISLEILNFIKIIFSKGILNPKKY